MGVRTLIPSADELAEKYSRAAGQTLAHWDFYMALAYFKLAIIAAGIDYRARQGGVDRRRRKGRGGRRAADRRRRLNLELS